MLPEVVMLCGGDVGWWWCEVVGLGGGGVRWWGCGGGDVVEVVMLWRWWCCEVVGLGGGGGVEVVMLWRWWRCGGGHVSFNVTKVTLKLKHQTESS